MQKRRTYGSGGLRQLPSGKWEISYRLRDGRRKTETVNEATCRKDADEALQKRVESVESGVLGNDVLMSNLFKLHVEDLELHDKDAHAKIVKLKIGKHLTEFGKLHAASLKKADITAYVKKRKNVEGAAKATINRELSIIRRSLKLGIDDELIPAMPKVMKLDESDNIRQGFIEEDEYQRMLAAMPEHLKIVWCFAYHLGMRSGELKSLRWSWLVPYWNEEKPIIKVPGSHTKSGKPHTIPVYGDMKAQIEKAMITASPKCDFIFQYRGKQIKNWRTGFLKARDKAKLPNLLFHDTRRSAIRNMERAGIPRSEARQVSGHQTESIYIRYDIASEKGATMVGDAMEAYHAKRRTKKEPVDTGE